MELHWLQRIAFKIAFITYKALYNLAPEFIHNLLRQYTLFVHLDHLLNIYLIVEPSFNRNTFGGRAFSISAPRLRKSLSLQ